MSKFVEIEHGSAVYAAELELRNRLLRIPLGLDIQMEDLNIEREFRHFGILAGNELVACLMAVPAGTGCMQLRQIAVEEGLQGKGIGRRLMIESEAVLEGEGTVRLILNSRDTAVGFYEKLGYEAIGEGFVEVGIAHQRMEKRV